jgi:hypothetical protein
VSKQPKTVADCSDIDALRVKGVDLAPSVFAALAFHLGCVIARELRLMRLANVRTPTP